MDEDFSTQAASARGRMDVLRDEARRAAPPGGGLVTEMFEELNVSLEELRVAGEELRQQNEELVGTRLLVEHERLRYQEIFDAAPEAYLVTDADGTIQEANRAASQLLGVSARFLAGKPLAAFVAPDVRAEFRTVLNRWRRDSEDNVCHTRLRPRRGATFPATLTVSAARDRGGALTGLRWLARDVSAHRVSRDSLEMLLDAAPVGFAFLDAEFRCVRVNEALAGITGRPAAEHLGRTVADILSPQHWRDVEPSVRRALAGETVRNETLSGTLPGRPGQALHLRFSCYPVMVGDVTQGVGLIVEDITAVVEAEEARSRDLAQSRRIADTLQTALMQTVSENAFPGLSLATLYKAASEEANVGGDFYDAFPVGGGGVALVVGDVSGKGLAAAAHIAEVKYALRAFLHETPRPGRALARLNDFVCETQRQGDWGDASLVVLALAVIRPETGEVTYASAGSEPLLVFPPGGGAEEHGRGSGLVLGVAPRREYAEAALTLPPGALLLMATDGITEARQEGRMLGMDGLKRLTAEALGRGALGEISRDILEGARSFAGGVLTDDACLLLARRRAA